MINVRYWLWFVLAFGVSSERIWEIAGFYRDVREAYENIKDGNHLCLNPKEIKKVKTTHIEQCDSIIEYCTANGYRLITFEDEIYPPLLRNIYNPPAVLFCMGNIENFINRPSITCVGTRKPSVYSANATYNICSELVSRGFGIVSGFALGLDSAAHKAALDKNGCTVAVLACGIDVDYPKDNAKSKRKIAVNGAVITEYLPGAYADRKHFQNRNRILAGLTFGTFVTEADEQSGSLITAEHAANQGKTVFCIPPGDIFDKRYLGVVKYLRDGAVSVYSHLDILREYYVMGHSESGLTGKDLPVFEGDEIPYHDTRTSKKKDSSAKTKAKKENTAEKTEETMQWQTVYDCLEDEQKSIIDFLKDGEKHPDEISQKLDMDSFAVMAAMTELEMYGAAELLPDHKYKLK